MCVKSAILVLFVSEKKEKVVQLKTKGFTMETKLNIVPLKGANYATWKIQCKMALIKDNLWNIVNESETVPPDANAYYSKYTARKDRALATIVLSIDPSLLYIIGDPVDPTIVWKKLADQFQKKTWANKLALRRRLFSLRLKEGNPVQNHIKTLMEIFEELCVIGDTIEEEDKVIYLLASLPDSFNMLVTELKANAEVPRWEIVTERLLYEETKSKQKDTLTYGNCNNESKAMTTHHHVNQRGPPKCYQCGKYGHLRRDCRELREYDRKENTKRNN